MNPSSRRVPWSAIGYYGIRSKSGQARGELEQPRFNDLDVPSPCGLRIRYRYRLLSVVSFCWSLRDGYGEKVG